MDRAILRPRWAAQARRSASRGRIELRRGSKAPRPRPWGRPGTTTPPVISLPLSRPWSSWVRSGGTTRPPPNARPYQGRNPSGLRTPRRFRLAGAVEGDGLAHKRHEGELVNVFAFMDVDRAARIPLETRVEEPGRILQRRAPGEGKLHDVLVGFARADDAVMRPSRSARGRRLRPL